MAHKKGIHARSRPTCRLKSAHTERFRRVCSNESNDLTARNPGIARQGQPPLATDPVLPLVHNRAMKTRDALAHVDVEGFDDALFRPDNE